MGRNLPKSSIEKFNTKSITIQIKHLLHLLLFYQATCQSFSLFVSRSNFISTIGFSFLSIFSLTAVVSISVTCHLLILFIYCYNAIPFSFQLLNVHFNLTGHIDTFLVNVTFLVLIVTFFIEFKNIPIKV